MAEPQDVAMTKSGHDGISHTSKSCGHELLDSEIRLMIVFRQQWQPLVFLSICLYNCVILPIYLSNLYCISSQLSIYQYIRVSKYIDISIYLISIHLSIHLSVRQSI